MLLCWIWLILWISLPDHVYHFFLHRGKFVYYTLLWAVSSLFFQELKLYLHWKKVTSDTDGQKYPVCLGRKMSFAWKLIRSSVVRKKKCMNVFVCKMNDYFPCSIVNISCYIRRKKKTEFHSFVTALLIVVLLEQIFSYIMCIRYDHSQDSALAGTQWHISAPNPILEPSGTPTLKMLTRGPCTNPRPQEFKYRSPTKTS